MKTGPDLPYEPSRRDAILGGAALATAGALAGRLDALRRGATIAAQTEAPFGGRSSSIYISNGAQDETRRLQDFIDGIAPGDTATIQGIINFTTLQISQDSIRVRLTQSTELRKQSAFDDGIEILGANVTLSGGSIVSPPEWDGTNAPWEYAVVHCKGQSPEVTGVTLVNVPRVGIGIRGVDNSIITNCRVEGNYPAEKWTGIETVNFGIAIDPSGSATDGTLVVSGNILSSTVQGIFAGNGVGPGVGQGITVSGNVFSGCWNHGIYVAGGRGVVVVANNFVRCQTPVAVTGDHHVVASNAMTTASSGDQRDITGISLRAAVGCVVEGNTISGDATAGSTVIDLRDDGVGKGVRDNVIANNVLDIRNGASEAIRVGRDSSVESHGNVIQGNRVRGSGRPGSGLIVLDASPASKAVGNQVLNNSIVVLGATSGLLVSNQIAASIDGNQVRIEFNGDSIADQAGLAVASGSVEVVARSNIFVVAEGWGENLDFRAIHEASNATGCRYSDNSLISQSQTVRSSVLLELEGSGHYVNETGPGVPKYPAVRGSVWHRTDGEGSALFVKESSHVGKDRRKWRAV